LIALNCRNTPSARADCLEQLPKNSTLTLIYRLKKQLQNNEGQSRFNEQLIAIFVVAASRLRG
jgi:hypothetical protein